MPSVLIEGYSEEELLELAPGDFDRFAFSEDTMVLKIGSAEVLASLGVTNNVLHLELAQIDGGGEGVLPCLVRFSRKLARKRSFEAVEWYVHAVTCANPNEKLRRLLILKGFRLRTFDATGEVYFYRDSIAP